MTVTEVSFVISGLAFGLSGLMPGPLLTLVVAETLIHGIKAGIRVALAPILTDLPIVLIAIYILKSLADIKPALGLISLAGAIFLIYLSVESISTRGVNIDSNDIKDQALKKGVITNFLNPSPYLFWLSIGAPTVMKATDTSILSAILFILFFYITLIGSKVVVAVLTGKSRHFLRSRHYILTIRFLGVVLLVFAALFIWNGLRYFDYFGI